MPLLFKEHILYDNITDDYKKFIFNVENSKYNDNECVILGNLGFMSNLVCIKPIRCKSLLEAFKTCVSEYKCIHARLIKGYIELKVDYNGKINIYEIHLLNNKGINLIGGDYSKQCYHKSIRGSLF